MMGPQAMEQSKTKNAKYHSWLFAVVNILLPLVFGAGLYLVLAPDTRIADWLAHRFLLGALPDRSAILLQRRFWRFVRNYLCDGLWAFALESCVALLLPWRKRFLWLSMLLSAVLSVCLELLQAGRILRGTFDAWDIVTEILAITMAGFNYFIWRSMYEKRN
ncbi:MAG: hypothetical protein IJ168_01870 [Eubacterium sp.]|nr:hypothetical protein [Eubacterium sp.]